MSKNSEEEQITSTPTISQTSEEILKEEQVARVKADFIKAAHEVKVSSCSLGSFLCRGISTIAQSINIASMKGSEVLQTTHDKLDEIHKASSLNK